MITGPITYRKTSITVGGVAGELTFTTGYDMLDAGNGDAVVGHVFQQGNGRWVARNLGSNGWEALYGTMAVSVSKRTRAAAVSDYLTRLRAIDRLNGWPETY